MYFSICCEEENGMETQALIQPGELCIFQFIYLFVQMIFMIIMCHAVYKIQPWIRLTLYNPNLMQNSKIDQKPLSNVLN